MIDLNDAPHPFPPQVRYDLDAIVAHLRATAESWVPRHFPNGRRVGDEWRLANIRGDAPRKQGSCVIALKGEHAGDWHDFDGGRAVARLARSRRRRGTRDAICLHTPPKWPDGRPALQREESQHPAAARPDTAREIAFIHRARESRSPTRLPQPISVAAGSVLPTAPICWRTLT